MKRLNTTVFALIAICVLSLLAAGCPSTSTTSRSRARATTTTVAGQTTTTSSGGTVTSASSSSTTSSGATGSVSNGRDIFVNGKSSHDKITFTGGKARSSGACANCHGANGKGGIGPNITYGALKESGFTDARIKRAITSGLDEKGDPLQGMPHYKMSNQDLNDLIAYLKTL
ncbi:MAG TPA: cytochrome c [Candidatus Aquicultor sp.]